MITPVIGQPGIQAGTSVTYRQVFKQPENVLYLPGGGTIDKAAQDPGSDDPLTLRGGLPVGRKTSGKKWLPSFIGKTISGALAGAGTSITLAAANALELVRRVGTSGTFKLTGPATTNGVARTLTVTFSNVNTSTGVVTITAVGVAQVDQFRFGTAATGGNLQLTVQKPDGTFATTGNAAWSATDATYIGNLNTVLDAATGVAGAIVASAISAVDTDSGFVLTYDRASYPTGATRAQVAVLPTSATSPVYTRTTEATDGRFVVGSFVQPTDGSEAPVSVVPSGSGIQMAAANARDVDFPQIPYSGLFDSDQIVDWPTDVGLQVWLMAQFNANGGRFEFDHLTNPA